MSSGAAPTLRPLGIVENSLFVMHKFGNTTNVFSTWIDTKTHVPDDTWEQALSVLQKNYPTLRLRVKERDGKRFFAYMEEPGLHFEAQSLKKAKDWKGVHEEMMRVRFDTENGPMWHVKLLRMPRGNSNDGSVKGVGEYGFQNVLMFVFHHGISDGKSNIIMLNRLAHILNACIAGEKPECGDVATLKPPVDQLIPRENMKFRLKDLKQLGKEIYNNAFPHENLFLKRFPPPQLSEGDTGCTRVVPLEFTVAETESLLNKCKTHGVTVNGIFMAAANLAMAQMVNEGADPRPLSFNAMHAVTLRRYIPQDLSNTLGMFIGLHHLALPVPVDSTQDQFWPQAKQATASFHNALDHDGVLQEYRVILRLFTEKNVVKLMQEKKCENEYESSNIGNYDIVYTAEDAGVRVHKVVSSTAMQQMHTPFIHYLRQFRGRFLYNLDYATNWASEANAHRYANMTVQLMREASRRGMCTLAHPKTVPSAYVAPRCGPSLPSVRAFIRLTRFLR